MELIQVQAIQFAIYHSLTYWSDVFITPKEKSQDVERTVFSTEGVSNWRLMTAL